MRENAFTCFLICVLMLLVSVNVASVGTVSVYAQEDNLEYILYDDYAELKYCISGSKVIEIPETVEGLPVKVIGDAFWNDSCKIIEEIIIPETVTVIGEDAFSGCSSLTSINIPQSVVEIGFDAFENCTSLENISLPDGLVNVMSSAFYNTGYRNNPDNWEDGVLYIDTVAVEADNEKLPEKVVVKEGTTLIAGGAFFCCDNITEVVLPDSLRYINYSAFDLCTNLHRVNIPANVKSIGGMAFDGCFALDEIAFPEGLESIGSMAFSATSMDSVYIPASVTDLNRRAFYFTSLEEIKVDPDNKVYCDIEGVVFSKDGTVLHIYPKGRYAEEYVVPSKVKVIGECAFEEAGVKSVKLPYGLVEIGDDAFYNSNIQSINIPDTVTILRYAFKGTPYLKNKDNYEDGILYNGSTVICSDNLSKGTLVVKEGIRLIGEYAFGESDRVTEIIISEGPEKIPFIAFSDCEKLSKVTLPDSIKYIDDNAFSYCEKMESIRMPANLESIGEGSFKYCKALKEITLPVTLRSIGKLAFEHCESLTHVEIPDGVQVLEEDTFSMCQGLKSISLPETLHVIEPDALRTVFSSKKELVIYAVEGSYAEIYAKENNYPFSPLSKFTDDVTGVTIVTSSEGEAVVRDITGETVVDFDEVNSENIKVFEVDVLCEGESSQIENGYCSIRFPAKDKNTKVYLLSENGEFIKITSSYIYDCAVVAVDKYGVFAVVDEDYKLGDANLDGKVNVKDATHIQKAVADLLVLDEIESLAADVDGNGKVNVKDATAIQKWVADIETGLPIGKEKTA